MRKKKLKLKKDDRMQKQPKKLQTVIQRNHLLTQALPEKLPGSLRMHAN